MGTPLARFRSRHDCRSIPEGAHQARRHAASAGEMFADVAAEADIDSFCGLEFIRLQFAADRAAQLAYKKQHAPGTAVRVFPFVLKPELAPVT